MYGMQDYIVNGEGFGPVGQQYANYGFDGGLLRPYRDVNGVPCVTVNTGKTKWDEKNQRKVPVYEKVRLKDVLEYYPELTTNATTLRKGEWIMLDNIVLRAARQRLRAWTDLASSNTFGGFDGMSKMILEHETMSDEGEALVDMDGLSEGRNTAPRFQLEGLPLPITHSDFMFSQRRLLVSRNGSTPLDSTMAEFAGRRVAETVEKTLIGLETGVTYGGNSSQVGGYGRSSKVYGYTNFPSRIAYTGLTVPLGTNPEATISDVLTMRDRLYAQNFFGPFMIYTSTDWDKYLDNDYARLGGNNASMTLRDRIRAIDGIQDVRRLDYLTPTAMGSTFNMIMVQMTQDVARAVIGMNIQTVQWPSQGGMRNNFKVMCIHVPQIRADFNGACGLLHATP